eukprot:COSAG01_NODE_39017_length_482_cov_0.655352_1_plen_127_part_01
MVRTHAHTRTLRAIVGSAVTTLEPPRAADVTTQVAQSLESADVEVGAVNCQTEAALCAERFNLRSYPTIRMLNRARGMQQEYHNSLSLSADSIASWCAHCGTTTAIESTHAIVPVVSFVVVVVVVVV